MSTLLGTPCSLSRTQIGPQSKPVSGCARPRGATEVLYGGARDGRVTSARNCGTCPVPARCNAPCAGCSCARAKPVAPACRGRHWRAHNHTRAAACEDGPGRASRRRSPIRWISVLKPFGVIGPPRSVAAVTGQVEQLSVPAFLCGA
jgi:hypothetical protein